jgi:hypothetical protein
MGNKIIEPPKVPQNYDEARQFMLEGLDHLAQAPDFDPGKTIGTTHYTSAELAEEIRKRSVDGEAHVKNYWAGCKFFK